MKIQNPFDMISINQKMIILLMGLVLSMYYWISAERGVEKIISMTILVILSFLLGKEQQKKINIGEINNVQSNSS